MNRMLSTSEKTLSLAIDFLGLQEIEGGKNNKQIMEMFRFTGHSWVKNDETAWCSCFINYIAKRLGLSMSGKLNARSWLTVGEEIKHPLPGDIVVFWRGAPESWKGHVGIFVGYNSSGNIYCLGGNQGNEVNISVYHKDRVLSFRRLLNV